MDKKDSFPFEDGKMKFDSWRVKILFARGEILSLNRDVRIDFFCGDPKSAGMQQKCEG